MSQNGRADPRIDPLIGQIALSDAVNNALAVDPNGEVKRELAERIKTFRGELDALIEKHKPDGFMGAFAMSTTTVEGKPVMSTSLVSKGTAPMILYLGLHAKQGAGRAADLLL